MAKAICPNVIPDLPDGTTEWRRSLRRGSMFHAHVMGHAACGSIYLDRHKSETADGLGDMQYWGVCPRCMAKAKRRMPERSGK